jgi:hypothetical protein
VIIASAERWNITGKRLGQAQPGPTGGISYLCLVHGRFWIDEAGDLRQERRKPGRTV